MSIFTTYFSNIQLALLISAALSISVSLSFQVRKKEYLALGFLLLTALLIFSFAALLDPFLNLWDERFHALVGKNLMTDPFKPTLYNDPIVDMAYDRWDRYHIWLHKQPFFLWQIALSFTLFGVSEFTLRLPDILLGVMLVLAAYRTGKLMINNRVGYFTGLLIISSIYLMELIGGRQELEHNDFSFLAYISFSIWSLVEYQYSGKKYWLYLIGIFSGIAILCKWLVGLLVYFGWAILRLVQKKWQIKSNIDILISLGITLVVSLPWQIYTFIRFPSEALQTYTLNVQHATIPLDGHAGSTWYHFNMFSTIYGNLASYLIVPALYFLYKRSNDKKLFFAMFSTVVVVFTFFSLVTTKMPSFTTVAAMIIFLAFASLLDYFFHMSAKLLKAKYIENILLIVTVVILIAYRFDVELLQEKHTNWKGNTYGQRLIENKEVFKSLELPKNSVLFNVEGRHYVEAMFHTGLPAYNFVPTEDQFREMKLKGRKTVIFRGVDDALPDYLTNDSSVVIINKTLWKLD